MKISQQEVSVQGSVRVDLVGGTLDIHPICAVLKPVVTLNMATSLMARVVIRPATSAQVTIHSEDYKLSRSFNVSDFTSPDAQQFGPLIYVASLLEHFITQCPEVFQRGCEVTIQSGSPPGAGLGGSSAMGVTIYKALAQYCGFTFNRDQAIKVASFLEARILDCGPTGYQDYYPAMYGGILALHAGESGIRVEQMFKSGDMTSLLSRLTLVYSGQTRLSAINNWEVFKGFFDRKPQMRHGLEKLAAISYQAYQALARRDWDALVDFIAQEGETRMGLFPNIATPEMLSLWQGLNHGGNKVGLKVCGAGGGGCFLLVHAPDDRDRVAGAISQAGMTMLNLEIMPPL